ncbi:zinc finger protein Eos-like [Oncorhynchus clarkii lewisi]|uniref:zinc finger protein Eos-like n=1 Tax=Oncorhynchus clarkii lewisi TaxID=490388 RepID=UPI0039B87B73
MNADDCNGHSYMSASGGETATEHGDFCGGLRVPAVRTQQSSLNQSLGVNSIKIEEDSDNEPVGALQPERRKGERDDREDTIEDGSGELGGRVGRGSAGSGYGELASPQPASPGPIRLPNGKLQCDVCGMNCIGPNVLMVHKRIHTGERPFQCTQCGASFTQKGNLLRHIKLHSGEKPFKCPFCNYACRRRDALSGHIRTHTVPSLTVGKPYKCSYCGRSYKQQITLEEHLERCHNYLKSLQNHQPALSTEHTAQGMEPMSEPEAVLQPSTEKLSFIDRLVNTITKRKRSTPQKFLGEKHMRLNEPDITSELSPGPEKEKDEDLHSAPNSHLEGEAGAAGLVGMGGRYLHRYGGDEDPGSEPPQLALPLPYSACLSDPSPVSSSVYSHPIPLGPQVNGAVGGRGGGVAARFVELAGREAGEGHKDIPSGQSPTVSNGYSNGPSNGCHDFKDKSDTESTAEEQQSTGVTAPTSNSNNHHLLPNLQYVAPALPSSRRDRRPNPNPRHAQDPDIERERGYTNTTIPTTVKGSGSPGPGSPSISGETSIQVQVVDREGRAVRSFRCEHCRLFFLDHVMFTIHMGCHGFHQPFQCNVCGHCSCNRYQFTSHIIRGEHQVG